MRAVPPPPGPTTSRLREPGQHGLHPSFFFRDTSPQAIAPSLLGGSDVPSCAIAPKRLGLSGSQCGLGP